MLGVQDWWPDARGGDAYVLAPFYLAKATKCSFDDDAAAAAATNFSRGRHRERRSDRSGSNARFRFHARIPLRDFHLIFLGKLNTSIKTYGDRLGFHLVHAI